MVFIDAERKTRWLTREDPNVIQRLLCSPPFWKPAPTWSRFIRERFELLGSSGIYQLSVEKNLIDFLKLE